MATSELSQCAYQHLSLHVAGLDHERDLAVIGLGARERLHYEVLDAVFRFRWRVFEPQTHMARDALRLREPLDRDGWCRRALWFNTRARLGSDYGIAAPNDRTECERRAMGEMEQQIQVFPDGQDWRTAERAASNRDVLHEVVATQLALVKYRRVRRHLNSKRVSAFPQRFARCFTRTVLIVDLCPPYHLAHDDCSLSLCYRAAWLSLAPQ